MSSSYISMALSAVAIAVGGFACFKVSQLGDRVNVSQGSAIVTKTEAGEQAAIAAVSDDHIRDIVIGVLEKETELLAKAIKKYGQREIMKIVDDIKVNVRSNFSAYSKKAIKAGKVGSSKKLLCYIDPCNFDLLSKISAQIAKSDNDIEFNILPVVMFDDPSMSMMLIAANKVDATKINKLLTTIGGLKEHNQESLSKAIADSGYDVEALYKAAMECQEDVQANMKHANDIGMIKIGASHMIVEEKENLVDLSKILA